MELTRRPKTVGSLRDFSIPCAPFFFFPRFRVAPGVVLLFLHVRIHVYTHIRARAAGETALSTASKRCIVAAALPAETAASCGAARGVRRQGAAGRRRLGKQGSGAAARGPTAKNKRKGEDLKGTAGQP